jgi:nucleoside-diphosphate-sugar epimerase
MSSYRIVVTGAAGFLGSYVARQLMNEGHEVYALLRPSSSLRQMEDLGLMGKVKELRFAAYDELESIFTEVQPAAVVHTAALSRGGDSPSEMRDMIESNVTFPSMILKYMMKAGVRAFVNTGTSWQNSTGGEFTPFNFYASTKQCLEAIIAAFSNDGLSAVTLRLFDPYGPYDRRKKIIDLLINCVLTGEELRMSPGEQYMDITHVTDVARAFSLAVREALSNDPGHRVYGVSGERIRLRDLAQMISEIAGRSCPIIWGGREYRPREIMMPWDGYGRLPNWRPLMDLRSGLEQQVRAYSALATQ